MKKLEIKPCNSDLLDRLSEALLCTNDYNVCNLKEMDGQDEDFQVASLQKGSWEDPSGEKLSKNMLRTIRLLDHLNLKETKEPAIVYGYCRVDVDRKKVGKTEIGTSYDKVDIKADSLDYQITERDYRKFISQYEIHTEYTPRIIKVVDLDEMPKCNKCGGSGEISCTLCRGFGKGECPDCKGTGIFGADGEWGKKKEIYSRIRGSYIILECGEHCPTCNGEGQFFCKACEGTGVKTCPSCDGSGRVRGDRAQKVTRLEEKYKLYRLGEIILPDMTTFAFDSMLLEELVKSKPALFRQRIEGSSTPKRSGEPSTPTEWVEDLYSEIMGEPTLVGLNFVAYSIPNLRIISFTYDESEYEIIVIGDRAFARFLPEILFMESLLGSYKKKVK